MLKPIFSAQDNLASRNTTPLPAALVRAIDSVVEQLESRTLFSVPNGPFELGARAVAATEVDLHWRSNSNDETGFTIERSSDGSNFAAIGAVGAGVTNFADYGAGGGTVYTYRVHAFSGGGDSSNSNLASSNGTVITPTPAPTPTSTAGGASYRGAWWLLPNGPYGTGAMLGTSGAVALSWTSNSDNEDGFKIGRRSNGGSFALVGSVGAGITTFTDTSAVDGTQYDYLIVAYNVTGYSSADFVQVTTPSGAATTPTPVPTPTPTPLPTPPSVPGPPTGSTGQPSMYRGSWWTVPNSPYQLLAGGRGAAGVGLIWTLNSNNEDGIGVERRTADGAYTRLTTLPYGTLSYTDATASPGTSYTYRVIAVNRHGESSPSNEATADPGPASVASAAGFFPVSVYYQPTYSFNNWINRGINTLYGYESQGGAVSLDQWTSSARQHGLSYIRQPGSNPGADATDPNLLAWLNPTDEPDLHGADTGSFHDTYAALKAASGSKPVITTYSGGNILGWQGNISSATYRQYFRSTDWVGADVYPVTGWGMSSLNGVGNLVDRVQQLAPGKKQIAFIETSNQQLPWLGNSRGVTPDEVRGEIWDAVIHGAGGIAYFPQQIGSGFSYDATPASVVAEMTTQDARLQQYGAALNAQQNPSWLQLYSSTGSPIEATWRTYNGKNYFFVLNLSNQTLGNQSMTVKGLSSAGVTVDGESRSLKLQNGTLTDSFAPYQMHVYVA